jgi:hypothetical protein
VGFEEEERSEKGFHFLLLGKVEAAK